MRHLHELLSKMEIMEVEHAHGARCPLGRSRGRGGGRDEGGGGGGGRGKSEGRGRGKGGGRGGKVCIDDSLWVEGHGTVV